MNQTLTTDFFKPTRLYKEFMLLDLIEKDTSLTQRSLSFLLKISVSMVNAYLEDFVSKQWMTRHQTSRKSVTYAITKEGVEARKLLNLHYLKASQGIYSVAALNILIFLSALKEKGFQRILFYGAGEVTRIFLRTIQEEFFLGLKVLGLIDDDKKKTGTTILGVPIISLSLLKTMSFDGILIASYNHGQQMIQNLVQLGISSSKILGFFDLKDTKK